MCVCGSEVTTIGWASIAQDLKYAGRLVPINMADQKPSGLIIKTNLGAESDLSERHEIAFATKVSEVRKNGKTRKIWPFSAPTMVSKLQLSS